MRPWLLGLGALVACIVKASWPGSVFIFCYLDARETNSSLIKWRLPAGAGGQRSVKPVIKLL